MPIMIPDIDPPKIGNSGERDLYKALSEQLPEDWVVRYHYPACWMQGTCLKECESDFIILAPQKGVLFLEVKASYGYDSQDGDWYRIKRSGEREKLHTSPWDQATSTKHQIVKRLAYKLGFSKKTEFPGIYGHMVVYPRARHHGKLPESIDSNLVLNITHMRSLKENLERAFELWGGARDAECWQCNRPFNRKATGIASGKGDQFTTEVMQRIIGFLKDDCQYVPVISPEVDEDEETIQELTQHQYRAFHQLLSNDRILVKGTAGSGKTMIAFWAAQALAEQGHKVLFLCYNRQLAEWLKLKHDPTGRLVTKSFFTYCREIVLSKGIRYQIPPGTKQEDFYKGPAADLFLQASDMMTDEEKYGVVIVDEAQDFHDSWWLPVQLSLKDPDNGRLYLFLDPNQAGVYGHGERYPGNNMTSQDLGENCRNTKRIVNYCSEILQAEIGAFELSPEGEAPGVLEPREDPSHRAKTVHKLVANLLKEGFRPSQIAILSPLTAKKSACSLKYFDHVDNVPVMTGESAIKKWLNDEVILGSTIKSFKGMEADFLIVTDVPAVGQFHFTQSDIYVAASRAKHRLAFVPANAEAAVQLKEFLLNNPRAA